MGGLLGGGGGGGGGLIGGPAGMLGSLPIVGELMPGAITQSIPRGPRQEELGYGLQAPLTPSPYTPFRGVLPPTGLDMPTGPGSLGGNPNAISPVAQAYPPQPAQGSYTRDVPEGVGGLVETGAGGGLLGGLMGGGGGMGGLLGGITGGMPGLGGPLGSIPGITGPMPLDALGPSYTSPDGVSFGLGGIGLPGIGNMLGM